MSFLGIDNFIVKMAAILRVTYVWTLFPSTPCFSNIDIFEDFRSVSRLVRFGLICLFLHIPSVIWLCSTTRENITQTSQKREQIHLKSQLLNKNYDFFSSQTINRPREVALICDSYTQHPPNPQYAHWLQQISLFMSSNGHNTTVPYLLSFCGLESSC